MRRETTAHHRALGRGSLIALVVASLGVGCELPQPAISCQNTPQCPPGSYCSVACHCCVALGPDAGALTDGGVSTDAAHADRSAEGDAGLADGGVDGGTEAGPPRCGTVRAIHDDFDDNDLDPQWYTYGNMPVLEQSQQLEIHVPADNPASQYGGVVSAPRASLRDSSVSVEVKQVASVEDPAEACLIFGTDDSANRAWICQSGGALVGAAIVGGVEDRLGIEYSGTEHRYWQIRHAGDRLYFEASPDRVDWTSWIDSATPPYVDLGWIGLEGGTYAPITPLNPVIFDNLNTETPATWCPATTFTDDFGDGVLDPRWGEHSQAATCQVQERGSQLQMSITTSTAFGCEARTQTRYDLEEQVLTISIPTRPSTNPLIFTGLMVWDHEGYVFSFGFFGSEIIIDIPSGGPVEPWAALPDYHDGLRVMHTGDQLHFMVRDNSTGAWDSLVGIGGMGPLRAVAVGLVFSAWGNFDLAQPELFAAAFDDYNLP